MTIEAGALALRISEIGGEQVEQKLNSIDNKAKALGSRTTELKFTAPGIERVDNQLEQLGKQVTLYKQGTQFANTKSAALSELGAVEQQLRGIIAGSNTTLEQRIAAEKQLNQLLGTRTAGTQSLTAAIGAQIAAYLTFRAVGAAYAAVTKEADRLTVAHLKLQAVANLTGTPLSVLTKIADDARQKFGLSAATAQDLTASFARLTARAGDVNQTGIFMVRWLDLAKANGLTLDEAMQALTSTLGGQNEGLLKLGLQNPSQIYQKWGAGADQASRMQAIVNEVLEQGEKVQGAYAAKMETTIGQQQLFQEALKDTYAAIGNNIEGTRTLAYEVGTWLAHAFITANNALSGFDDWLNRIDDKITPAWLAKILRAVHIMGPAPAGVDPLADDPALAASVGQMNAAAGITKPKPRPTLSAAERQALENQRLEREIAAAMAKTSGVGIPDIADIITPVTVGAGKPTVGVDSKGKMHGVKPTDVIDEEFDKLEAKMKERQERMEQLVGSLAQSVGSAFGDAFSSAFKGGNFFKEFGKSLISSLGNVVLQLGEQLLAYGLVIAPLAALLSFTPFGGLGLGAGASIAAGLALTALGAAMGAVGGGGGKGGAGASAAGASTPKAPNAFEVAFDPDHKSRKGPAVVPSSRSVDSTPLPDSRPIVQIGVLNALSPDDPRWQREIATTYQNAMNRGLIRKAG